MKRIWDHPRAVRSVLYMLLFCIACWIAWNTPYCHDEWRWSTPERFELMKQGFPDYNGRYLGNLLAIVITRNAVIRMLIMGGGFCLLVWGIIRCIPGHDLSVGDTEQAIIPGRKEQCLLLFTIMCPVLLLLMPQRLYEQSFGWSAAFVNFIPPVILFLLWFSMAEKYVLQRNGYRPSVWISILCFPLCFCAQLFSEHNTIAFLFFTLSAALICIIRKKKAILFAVCSFTGTLAGTVLMFSNGAYHRAAVRPTGYKHIAVTVSTLAEQWHGTITEYLCYKPLMLHILLAVSLIVLTILKSGSCRSGEEDVSGKRSLGSRLLLIVMMVSGICFFAFQSANEDWFIVRNTVLNDVLRDGIILVFYLCVLFLTISVSVPEDRAGNAGIWLMTALVSAPLTAAAPIGARCFFVTYVLELVLLFRLWAGLLYEIREICCMLPERQPGEVHGIRRQTALQILTLTGMALLLSLGVFYVRSFMVIGASIKDRKVRIEEAVSAGAELVELPYLPLGQFFWLSEPADDSFLRDFKYFYQIPETMKVEFY